MPLSKCVSASYTGRTLYGHAYLHHCCGAHHILINLFHWIVPLWVNTWIPSHTLARPSHILQKNRQNGTERTSSKAINFRFENDDFFTFKDDTNEFRDPENIVKHKLHGKIRVFLRSFTRPNRQWNVIEVKVWARLTPIWALVPLSHYKAWLVPLCVNTFLPSNTLARPSLIVQNGRQNATERKSSKDGFYRILISHLKTNTF